MGPLIYCVGNKLYFEFRVDFLLPQYQYIYFLNCLFKVHELSAYLRYSNKLKVQNIASLQIATQTIMKLMLSVVRIN
jgi:hypothetical protein